MGSLYDLPQFDLLEQNKRSGSQQRRATSQGGDENEEFGKG